MVAAILSQPLLPTQEAAVLFAEGRDREAQRLLQRSLLDAAPDAGPELWMLSMALHRLQGRKEAFDQCALAFTARFDRAAPAWNPTIEETQLLPEIRMDGPACVILAGDLDVSRAIALNTRDVLGRCALVRFDATCLQSLDRQACSVLLDTTERLMEQGIGLYFTGAERLAHALRQLLAVHPSFKPSWDLLLRVWQIQNEEREFTRVSLEYSLALGVAPPEWESVVLPVVGVANVQEKRGEPRYQAGPEVLRMLGSMVGSQDFHLKELQNFALDRKYVNIDMSQLRRIDVAAARALVEHANALIREGKIVRLLRQHGLILTLLRLLEIHPSVVCTPLDRT